MDVHTFLCCNDTVAFMKGLLIFTTGVTALKKMKLCVLCCVVCVFQCVLHMSVHVSNVSNVSKDGHIT